MHAAFFSKAVIKVPHAASVLTGSACSNTHLLPVDPPTVGVVCEKFNSFLDLFIITR